MTGVAGIERLWTAVAVAVLVALSLALRVFALDWGLPHYDPGLLERSYSRQSYHMDEDNYLWSLALMRPAQGNFDIQDYHWGSLQHYLVYASLLAGSTVGLVPAPWEDAFLSGDASALPAMYMLGRLVSALAGVGATLAVAATATLLAGRVAGIAAGLLYALAPLAVVEAHFLTGDITMSALVMASVLAGVVAVRQAGGPDGARSARKLTWLLLVAGLLLGLAIAAKYSAMFAFPGLLAAQVAVRRLSDPGSARSVRTTARVFLLPWAAVVLGFLAGEPYALLAPGRVIDGMRTTSQGNLTSLESGFAAVLDMLWWQGTNLAGLGLTWPVMGLAVGGLAVMMAWIVWRLRGRGEPRGLAMTTPQAAIGGLVVLAAIAGLVFGLTFNRIYMVRYSQPLIPLLCVAAGLGWAAIPWGALRAAVGAAALAAAGVVTLGLLSLMADTHPANMLATWMALNLKDGQVVAKAWPEYPLLDEERYRVIRIEPWRPEVPGGERPDYIIMDDMLLARPEPSLPELLNREYREVSRFSARPHIGSFSWDEGTTPHDWKYSHPTLVVYARR